MNSARMIAKNVTWRYVIALCLVALLTTTTFLMVSRTIAEEESRSAVVKLAADQRTLSQRIAFFANAFVTASTAADRDEYRRELLKTVRAMERAHEGLTAGDANLGVSAEIVASIQSLYFKGDRPFDTEVRNYLKNARALADLPEDEIGVDHPTLAALNLAGTNFIMQTHDLIVRILQQEGEQAIFKMERMELWLWLSTLLLLLLEGLFIFRPLARRIRTNVQDIEAAERRARHAARDAEAAAAAKTNFLRTMSHEIRTPLNAVLGMTHILMQTKLDAEQKDLAGHVKQSGEHLLQLLNDILDFSRLEMNKLTLEDYEFNLRKEIETCLSILAPLAGEKSIALTFKDKGQADDWYVGDSGRLRQVVMNLVGNAIKFTEHGKITVIVENSGPVPGQAGADHATCFKISVADTGIGIPQDKLELIFEEFNQADSSVTRTHGGSGLGLSICRGLVQLMGGQIGVESVEGIGSRFWFTVPLRAAEISVVLEEPSSESALPAAGLTETGGRERSFHHSAHNNPVPAAAPAGQTPAPGLTLPLSERAPDPAGLHILLAEDNQPNQMIARIFLERKGHKVQCVANGREAVHTVKSRPFDLILMDINMPVMDGVTATQKIRALPSPAANTPIIALTAHAMSGERERLIAQGMTDYLSKPLQEEDLFALIARVMAAQPAAERDVA